MLTPEQKIKREILTVAIEQDDELEQYRDCLTVEKIDDAYMDAWDDSDAMQDATEEFRMSGEETDIPAGHSRHYESVSHARKLSDGSWVGWTYWYGGGKHGEPEAIDWMSEAYELAVTEEEKLVVVRTFAKVE